MACPSSGSPLPESVWDRDASDGLDHRIAMGEGAPQNNAPTMVGVKFVEGYTPMHPLRNLDYRKEPALRLAGADWVWVAAPEGELPWQPVPAPLPRVRLVTGIRVSDDPGRDVESIDLKTCALVERPLQLAGGTPGSAKILSDRPGRIDVETTSPTDQLLVLSERFHSGWKVSVDGQNQKLHRVNGDFQGCVVPAGPHTVRFIFEPRSFTIGMFLTVAALFVMLIWLGVTLSNERRAGRKLDEHRGLA